VPARRLPAAIMYPTKYISYSFDTCSWNLRDRTAERKAFAELRLEHLVWRHIFKIGEGSSAELTFLDIAMVNHLADSGYKGALRHLSLARAERGGS
jgi:hypothetical protein